MNRMLQRALLGGYRVFSRGLLRHAWGRRAFYRAYDLYKAALEAGPIGQLRAFVPSGSHVIDVGANVGFFAERFAAWVGDAGHVTAIEPESANFTELADRLRRKGLSGRVTLHQAVADAKAGMAHLVVNPDHPGDHKLGAAGVAIEAVTLDQVAAAASRVSLVKIDVQGAELRVLAGAGAILERDKPALFIEVDPQGLSHFGGNVGGLIRVLEPHGYTAHRLTRAGAVPCSSAAMQSILARKGYTDFLFLSAR